MVAIPTDADQLKEYIKEMAWVKRLILDGVRDHIVLHIDGKDTAKQMWDALATLYQVLLSNRICTSRRNRLIRMQKGEGIGPFLTRI